MKLTLQFLIYQFIFLNLAIAQPTSYQQKDSSNSYLRFNEVDCERAQVIRDYQDGYLATSVSNAELGWNGNVDACIPGKISDLAMEKTLNRINYFRALVGVDSKVIFNKVKNEKAQKAVLMMDAENKLDHFPTSDWKCSTPEGIEAAGKSNLSYGRHSSASVAQYIRDSGSGNGAVGHRRWILFPKAHEFGFGSTNWGTAMWVIGGTKNPDFYPEFVAYPSPGYFPKNLIYPRWSFSKKGANFSSAKIRIYNESGTEIAYEREEVVNGYGDHTLVWVPDFNVNDNSMGSDFYARVEIDSVKTGVTYESFTYEVLGIIPEIQEEEHSLVMPTCDLANGEITVKIPTGYKHIEWSTGQQNQEKLTDLIAGDYSVTITDKIGCDRILDFKLADDHQVSELSAIGGNLTSVSGQSETYSTDQINNGTYSWSVSNGNIVSQDSGHMVEIIWDEGVSTGTVCVLFNDAEGCQSNEVCTNIELSTSSIKEHLEKEIQLFPNPVLNKLNLSKAPASSELIIEIYNSGGSKLEKILLPKGSVYQSMDVSSWTPGIYFIKVNNDSLSSIHRFVKL